MLGYFKREWIDRLDPNQDFLKQAIRTALAATFAIMLNRNHPEWQEAYWCIFAAAFLSQTRLGDTQSEQVLSIMVCTLYAGLLAVCAGLFSNNTLLLACYLGITSFVTVYIGVLGQTAAINGFFVNLFAILSGGLATSWHGQSERLWMILLGGFIALCMSFIFPTRITYNWRKGLNTYLLSLSEFSETLSNTYLHPEYHKKEAGFENRLHERRNRIIRFLNTAKRNLQILEKKSLLNSEDSEKYILSLEKAELIHMSLISLGNIRHRLVAGHDVSAVKTDIQTIHHELAQYIKHIALHENYSVQLLNDSLIHLEENIAKQRFDLQGPLIAFVNQAHYLVSELNQFASEQNAL